MTCGERVAAALAMERPDRVPIVPQFVMGTALRLCDVTPGRGYSDPELAHQCMLRVFDQYGGWDALYQTGPDVADSGLAARQPLRFLAPGRDLPDDAALQVHEAEVITLADYDLIAELGWARFYDEVLASRLIDGDAAEAAARVTRLDRLARERCAPDWAARGVAPMYAAMEAHPFFTLSLGRSLLRFTEDLYFRPQLVERVLPAMTRDLIERFSRKVAATGIKGVLLAEERVSAFHYPLRIFDRFWAPYTVQIVDAMWSMGVITTLHLDTDFSKNLPWFRQHLPRGSYVLQLDHTTDIFAAKELLDGHAMFHGDLPAAMQSIGRPEDVAAYVKRLIDGVGYNGGFILGVACNTAPDCRPENFRAFLETGRSYAGGRRP
ncbi:MAG: hypothetical protein FJ191_00555 [Gammaproteobacteria bacterium]|nr:hypothetical protein [Gammaproteobacteria bacterium]